MTGPTTIRRVAGDVNEFTLPPTLGTNIRWSSCRDGEATLTALPVGQTAVRAYISSKSARSGITATSANPFFLFLFHFESTPFVIGWSGISPEGASNTPVALFFAAARN
jgi:hypothetical protein